MPHIYRDYVAHLAQRFEAEFSQIRTGFNFDYGPEFEVAIANALQAALPDSYGVARGHIVDKAGDLAGDDIVIFERARFPTFGLRKPNDLARKEYIPVEAAYCYIEAKHSIILKGEGPGTLSKALSQVDAAKALAAARPQVPLSQITPHVNATPPLLVQGRPHYPKTANPFFGMILARHVRAERGGRDLIDPDEIARAVVDSGTESLSPPDCVVLGRDTVLLPSTQEQGTGVVVIEAPFFIPGRTLLTNHAVPGTAFGVAIISLLAALDWIRLGTLPWPAILGDALGIPFSTDDGG